MNILKRYIFALVTLLMLPAVVWAEDIQIMGLSCTGNTTITTSTPGLSGILYAGTIAYESSTHTVTLDGVVAHCFNSKEFISNRPNGATLTVIVNSTCTITGQYMFDLDNEGTPNSSPGNLIIKSGRADNGVVDLNLNVEHQPEGSTGNACAIIMGYGSGNTSSYSCKLINLNINVSTQDGTRFFYGKFSTFSMDFYNCSVYIDNAKRLFFKYSSVTLNIYCHGMIADAANIAAPNSESPLVIKREISTTRTTTTQIVTYTGGDTDQNKIEKSFSTTTTSTPTTQTITIADEINLTTGSNIEPTVTSLVNTAGGYFCRIPENDYTCSYPTSCAAIGGPYTMTISGTGNTTGSVTKNYYVINPFFDVDGVKYRATSLTTASVSASGPDHVMTGPLTIHSSVSYVLTNPSQTLTLAVTGVESDAFKEFTALKGVNLPATITSIGNGAFTGCTALRYIDVSEATGFTPSTLERSIAASPFYGVPKQALVYLNGSPVTGENYVYKVGTADYRCHEFRIYDDTNGSQTGLTGNDYKWSIENIHPFTARNIVNTRYLRAGQHYTVFLPYGLPIPAEMKAYTLNGANTSKNLIGFTEVTTGTLTRFTPYVVIASATGQLLGTTNAYVPVFDENASGEVTTANGVTINGSMKYISGNDANGYYIMQSGDTWKKVTGGDYTDVSNKACILPMRAYISGGSSGARSYFKASFTDAAGNTTAIDQLRLDDNLDGAVYDLQGRKVQSPQRKVIYIINGDKIVK